MLATSSGLRVPPGPGREVLGPLGLVESPHQTVGFGVTNLSANSLSKGPGAPGEGTGLHWGGVHKKVLVLLLISERFLNLYPLIYF